MENLLRINFYPKFLKRTHPKVKLTKYYDKFYVSLLKRAVCSLSKLGRRADPLIERRKIAFPEVSSMQNRRNLFEEVSEAEAETRNEKFDFSRKS